MTIGYINYYAPTRNFHAEPYPTTEHECETLEAFTSAVDLGRCASLRVTDTLRWAVATAEDTPMVETVRFMLRMLDRELRRLQRSADDYYLAQTRVV